MVPSRALLVLLVFSLGCGSLKAQDFGAPPAQSLWDEFQVSTLLSDAHRALGYISPTLGSATYLTMRGRDGEGESDDASSGHRELGLAAAWTAGFNLALGLLAHADRLTFSLDPSRVLTRENAHAVVATMGAGFMVAAGVTGGNEGHARFGEAGTALMGLAILLEW